MTRDSGAVALIKLSEVKMSLSLGLRENEPGVRVQTFFGLPSTEEDVTQRRPESTAEELLLDRLRSGEEAAFLELMQRYHTSLLGTARFYVRKRDVAEEVVQDTWMSVLRGIHRFEARSSLKTWIFRILVNCAIKRRKREEKLVPFSSLVETETEAGELAISPDRFHPAGDLSQGHWASPPASWGENPEERLLAQESMEQLRNATEELPPAQKTVLTLRDVSGWTSQEVCTLLEISAANQRVLLHRARSKIRNALETYLGKD